MGAKPAPLEACERYDAVAEEVAKRPPSEAEADYLFEHEEICPRHSVTALEEKLGIPAGSLRHGSAEDGIDSAAEVMERILSEL